MANIYIKSFNRPFYLDRCIRSIKFNVRNYDRIVVLDDGTLSVYVERIKMLHPDVEFRSSGADDGKVELLRQERFEDIAACYPSATEFWVREIAADASPYCMVVEDDVWLVRRLDLGAVVGELERHRSVIAKLWWGKHKHNVIGQVACDGLTTIEFVEPKCDKLSDAYSIWIVAFAIYRSDYWLRCVSEAHRLGDERSQLIAACEFANVNPHVRFAKSSRRLIHQGWVIPGRSTPEYYEKGLIQHLYMDALNSAWYEGQLDAREGYPFDFSRSVILRVLASRLPVETVDVWERWHSNDIVYYYD